jgi:predicted SnoaL-like aldol condensation-catalyzing enzyme
MKKLFSFLATVIISFFLFISCSSDKKAGLSDVAQKNLEAYRAVSNAFQTGDISKIDNVVAGDFIDHTDKGDVGRDSLKTMITAMHVAQGDMKTKTVKEFADDEYVFALMNYTGNSDGSMGMPKGPYDMSSIEVVKFKNGKAIEHWAYMEPREMMKMMAGVPPSPPMSESKQPAKDPTSK